MQAGTVSGAFYHAVSDYFRISVRDPTADVRLIEYCFGIPVNHYSWRGEDRALIRYAMRDFLPETIVRSRRRVRQAADLCGRLIDAPDEVDAALIQLARSGATSACVDVPELRRSWGRVRSGQRDALLLAHSKLMRGLMVGLAVAATDQGC